MCGSEEELISLAFVFINHCSSSAAVGFILFTCCPGLLEEEVTQPGVRPRQESKTIPDLSSFCHKLFTCHCLAAAAEIISGPCRCAAAADSLIKTNMSVQYILNK